jgi:hypothetical protein
MDDRAGEPNTGKALAMLTVFASVGATAFDVTRTDLVGQKVGYRPNRSVDELRRMIGRTLQDANRDRHNIIIRPRSTAATLIQLDDLDPAKAERIAPHAFMVLCTSPRNYQAWIAVRDPTPDFSLRLKRGTGADPTASGATRISGSPNFKRKYAPAFPVVEITYTNAGHISSMAALKQAGLVAALEQNQPPPAIALHRISPPRPAAGRKWPDYQQTLRGAPLNRDGREPDRSRADFMWCKWAVQRGWSIEETASRLVEVSEKAQERIRLKDDGYPLLTARNAAAAVERERGYRQPVKSTHRPA